MADAAPITATTPSPPVVTGTTNTTPDSVQTGTTQRLGKPWKISEDGMQFIADWEGFKSHIYDKDGAAKGNATIGYGHLVHIGPISGAASETPYKNGITKEQALTLLKKDLESVEKIVNKNVAVPLHQYEYDALTAFIYNLHNNGLKVLAFVNKGQYADVTKK